MRLASGHILEVQPGPREDYARLFKSLVLALPVMLRKQFLAARGDRAQLNVP
jgi:hypothetical protein